MKDITDFIIEYLMTILLVLGTGFSFWYFTPEETVSIQIYILTAFPLAILSLFLIKILVTRTKKFGRNDASKAKSYCKR